MKKKLLSIAALLAAGAVLAGSPGRAAGPGDDAASGEAAVRRADAALAATANAANADAWTAFYAPDAIVVLPGDRLAAGAERIHDALTRLVAQPLLSVAWHPLKLTIAASGDLAYVAGAYELRFGGARAAPTPTRGTRMEIWRRQAGGAWKCIVDAWSADEATAIESSASSPSLASPAPVAERAPAGSVAVPPAPGPAGDSKYGDQPRHYEAAVRDYFRQHLNDPDSIQYRDIGRPERGYTKVIAGTVLMREKRLYGWTVKATVNARNSRGSYVGFKSYTFLFRGEKIVDVVAPLPDGEMN